MSPTGSLFSQTLQEITNTKLDELAKKKAAFDKHHKKLIAAVQNEQNAVKMLSKLSTDVKALFSVSTVDGRVDRGSSGNPRLEIDLSNLDRFLAQARYDPSMSPKILGQWQQSLLRHVDIQSLKYSYASLYGQLTTEWLSTKEPAARVSGEDVNMDDFEHVSGGKNMESRLKWERSVFEPAKIDVKAVMKFLSESFESTPEGSKHLVKALQSLREKVKDFERELMSPGNFTTYTLRWAMAGLLSSDLLTNEKRAVLKDFMDNLIILREIADVLNMRMAALDTWSWGEEVQLEERRQLNGTYNIYMHEDLLQAIFLQYIGVKWSVFWKRALSQFRKTKGVWKSPRTSIPPLDKKRREYYLGVTSDQSSVEYKKQRLYRKSYFLSQLLEHETQEVLNAEGEEEADFEEMHVQSASTSRKKQAPRKSVGGKAPRMQMAAQPSGAMRHRKIIRGDDDYDDEFDDEGDDGAPLNPMEAKQGLLHLLSTDITIKCRLHGEITCFRSQIDSLFPSLPHATIEKVFSFLGVSRRWMDFFRRFLQAPLRFMDDKASKPRIRKQGTPGSHVLSDVFGEVVLFCLDFKINQDTGGHPIWRMHDDIWFWSSNHETCVKAWSSVSNFSKIMGLSLNDARTGGARMLQKSKKAEGLVSVDVGEDFPNDQIRWGMLVLNPESGHFEIDQEMVDKHVEELSRQLKDKTGSLFAWIQSWNAYAAKFFTSNFGKPANCYGRQHVDNMLATHERIQRQIFSSSAGKELLGGDRASGSVIEFLKLAIEQRFGITDIPDGYFFFPTELGGLDVQNPFIGLLQIRDAVVDRPSKLLDEFEEAEAEDYMTVKRDFESRKPAKQRHPDMEDWTFMPEDPETFFSFEEYTKYREELNYGYENELAEVYEKLLEKPNEMSIDCDDNGNVKVALNSLDNQSGLKGILDNWYSMEPYWKWVAQLYGPEMIERFGGFSIVDPGLLPMGMISLFRSGRVQWQE
ncbi:hypothetical protein MMC08_007331 [Hypocenomyce scalaris]|nr:hypothetical protein [Hypocenomyce scalaris]